MSTIAARRAAMAAVALVLSGAAFGIAPGPASVRQVAEDDDDDAAYRAAMVRRSLEENCLICHTEDIITGQRLTPSQWKAEVDKMLNWGAPLPKEAAGPLVEYLAHRYSDREPSAAPARSRLSQVASYEVPGDRGGSALAPGDPAKGERLDAANCATCHGPTALGGDLGPALTGKAVLNRRRDYDRIVDQGLHRMPGFRLILKGNEPADILAWLRERVYPESASPRGR